MNKFMAKCNQCHRTTSSKYARANGGKCKSCVTGIEQTRNSGPTRNERMIDSGWQAYAREEGHYDLPDYA